MRISMFCLPPLLLASAFAQDSTVTLKVDATDAPRRLFHVQMKMPAPSGSLTLLYPKWIPGEHMPVGPITNLGGLKIMAAGQPLAWRRDDVNMYAFRVDVPPDALVGRSNPCQQPKAEKELIFLAQLFLAAVHAEQFAINPLDGFPPSVTLGPGVPLFRQILLPLLPHLRMLVNFKK
jgi:hypothetical protein